MLLNAVHGVCLYFQLDFAVNIYYDKSWDTSSIYVHEDLHITCTVNDLIYLIMHFVDSISHQSVVKLLLRM